MLPTCLPRTLNTCHQESCNLPQTTVHMRSLLATGSSLMSLPGLELAPDWLACICQQMVGPAEGRHLHNEVPGSLIALRLEHSSRIETHRD